jgi:putative CocE/NonD family hydrolase
VRGLDNGVETDGPVRLFVMGESRWHRHAAWPPRSVQIRPLWLAGDGRAQLGAADTPVPGFAGAPYTSVASNPASPVTDPYDDFGAHDYRDLGPAGSLAVFETVPLDTDLEVTGAMEARLFVSCDCPDFDLWVKVLDVHPDGAAYNLMSPGLDVQRMSYREPEKGRQLLEPGEIYEVRLPYLITSNRFRRGHRLRVVLSGSFFPHFSRNLQTGERESTHAVSRSAKITIHHDAESPSHLLLPVVERGPADP